MKSNTIEQEKIKQYLLGCAPEAELGPLEERLLSDSNFYEELLIVEVELIDQYLSDGLSEPERDMFVSHFLAANERREKLRFSQTLRKYLTDTAQDEDSADLPAPVPQPHTGKWFLPFFSGTGNPARRLFLAAAVLLVVFGISWIIIKNLPSQVQDKPQRVFAVSLTPGLVREGGAITRVSIPTDKDLVRLQLEVSSSGQGRSGAYQSYQSYKAELKTFENSTLLVRDKLRPEVIEARRIVNMDVPAEILNGGDYQVRLSGLDGSGALEPVGRYDFRVVSR